MVVVLPCNGGNSVSVTADLPAKPSRDKLAKGCLFWAGRSRVFVPLIADAVTRRMCTAGAVVVASPRR
jgi:hypothetical protein